VREPQDFSFHLDIQISDEPSRISFSTPLVTTVHHFWLAKRAFAW